MQKYIRFILKICAWSFPKNVDIYPANSLILRVGFYFSSGIFSADKIWSDAVFYV